MRKKLRAMGLAIVGSMLLFFGSCDLQHPPDNTEIVLGVAIAR